MDRLDPPDQAWVRYIADTYSLAPDVVVRLREDFLAWDQSTVREFVTRVHLRLQGEGRTNDEIFRYLAEEIPRRRFRVATPSLRQIRRWIYG